MKRLFTFGCSFTHFDWPTWANLLGLDNEYDLCENWGFSGLGNLAIAQRIAECHSKHNFTKDDTVVVQWSSHIRNDYHRQGTWDTKGSIFNMHNVNLYNKAWINHFFDERSYTMYSLNAMMMAQGILKSASCKWAMTTIGDFNKLGNDFLNFNGDGENSTVSATLLEEYPEFEHYIKSIWDNNKNHWVESIGSFTWKEQQLGDNQFITDDPKIYKFVNKNPKTLKKQPYWWDSHPSTVGHARWLQECLLPVLQKETKFNDKQNKLNSDINNFYCKQEWELFDFREQLTQLMNLDLQETLHKVRGH